MKDRILIFLYEVQCVLKDFAVVFCALFGIKIKTFIRVDWVDKLLMLLILILLSVLIFFIVKYDYIVSII